VFPHHENEIAQSEGFSGVDFVRYWLHNGYISIDSKKMSKSLGNFFTVRDAAKEYGYENIRMFILMSHYRSPLNFSGEILLQAKNALDRLKTARQSLEFVMKKGLDSVVDNDGSAAASVEGMFLDSLPSYKRRFIVALDDDFNTADAISVIFELVRESNSIAAGAEATKGFAKTTLDLLDELTGVLGLFYTEEKEALTGLDAEIETLIKARNIARTERNWEEADKIRDQLNAMGIVLEDTPQGVKWKKK
jgi:cysteinyl-tRNA synthetase